MRHSRSSRAYLLIVVLLTLAGGAVWLFHARRSPGSDSTSGSGIRNVVLISIDTCRADHLSCYGYGRQTTPYIDAIAREGVRFTRAHSTNPITLPAHSSMLTGTNPPFHGVHDNSYFRLGDANVTLAEVMQDHGFRTAAFVGAFPLDSRFGLDQGFETYDDENQEVESEIFFNERKAEEVSREANAWLDEHGSEPFFLFLHYFDPHFPYAPPEPFPAIYPDQPYTAEVAYTDNCIGKVIEKLKALGLYDSTLFVITADHAESLGQHGEPTHTFFIYQSTINVPLIIKSPRGLQGKTVDEPVSIIDVLPTVLGLQGLPVPPPVRGEDLSRCLAEGSQPSESRYLYCESLYATKHVCSALRGVIHGKWKYIWTVKPELYDLEQDPAEAVNLVHDQPEIARELEAQLRTILAERADTVAADRSLKQDRQSVERLESLGYIGSGSVDTSLEIDPNIEDPKDFVDLYRRLLEAKSRYSEGYFAEAQTECLEIIKQRPETLEVYSILGGMALEEERYADAVQHYSVYLTTAASLRDAASPETLARIDTEIAYTQTKLGQALWLMGKTDEAIAHYHKSLEIDPECAETHSSLGKALLSQNKQDEGIHYLRQSLRIDAEVASVQDTLGVILCAQGKLDEGVHHLRLALRIDAENPEVHFNMGVALSKGGKLVEAAGHYRQAVTIQPGLAKAHRNLGELLLSKGRLDEGIQHLRQALRNGAELAEVHYNLGIALARQGKVTEAIDHFRQAVKIDPKAAKVHVNLGVALASQGELDQGIHHLREALRIGGEIPQIHYNLGAALADQGKLDEAIDHFRQTIKLKADYAKAYYQLAVALVKQDRIDEARQHLKDFGLLQARNIAIINQWAWARATPPDEKFRDAKAAVVFAEIAAELSDHRNARVLDTLAAAYAAARQFDRAVSTAEKAIKLASDADDKQLTSTIDERLKLYRQSRPYQEPQRMSVDR